MKKLNCQNTDSPRIQLNRIWLSIAKFKINILGSSDKLKIDSDISTLLFVRFKEKMKLELKFIDLMKEYKNI